jgi:hypothetical protein
MVKLVDSVVSQPYANYRVVVNLDSLRGLPAPVLATLATSFLTLTRGGAVVVVITSSNDATAKALGAVVGVAVGVPTQTGRVFMIERFTPEYVRSAVAALQQVRLQSPWSHTGQWIYLDEHPTMLSTAAGCGFLVYPTRSFGDAGSSRVILGALSKNQLNTFKVPGGQVWSP